MEKIIINGRARVSGRVRISGSKNATLPIMAACLLTDQPCVLHHVPDLEDVHVMEEVLSGMGASVKREQDTLVIHCQQIHSFDVPDEQTRRMRASNLVMGALLGRFHQARVSYPGGCAIGQRPMDIHIKGFRELGYEIAEEYGFLIGKTERMPGGDILLDFPSVGATENLMMASAISNQHTVIRNAAREPEIVDLQNFLNRMGARIRGAGLDTIRIEGVPELIGVEHEVIPDRIEAGTYIALAVATGGDVILENIVIEHLEPIIAKLKETGASITRSNGRALRVVAPGKLRAVDVKTMPYPGFPTDMQPQMMALLGLADGTSVVVETIFENRFMHVSELCRMGADIRVEGRAAVIRGTRDYQGARVEATDLRAGAALILAGTTAEGQTVIENAGHIFRGYEKLEEKLGMLGISAQIIRK